MDPQATVTRIIEARNASDHDEMWAAMEDLAGWMRRGGYTPANWQDLPRYVRGMILHHEYFTSVR